MSLLARMRLQRDRPVAEHERTAAMVTVAAVLLAATVLLSLGQPGARPQIQLGHGDPPPKAREAQAVSLHDPPAARPVPPAARLFLAGYLAYVYGHIRARAVKGATSALIGSLQAHPPRVSVAMRARRPRILGFRATAGASGQLVVSALVGDGGVADYSVGLLVASDHGRLLVARLEDQ